MRKTMLNSISLGNKISQARKKLNLSQAELGQQISISPQAVGKWERGESMPDISTLNRLAQIFCVDLNYFSDSFQKQNLEKLPLFHETVEEEPSILSKKNPEWNWDMSEGNWLDADFSGLKNLNEKFGSSNMKNCKFNNSDLSGLVLGRNNIEICDFTGSDLRNSKFQSSNLLNSIFNTCSFIDAEFFRTNVEKCKFSDANFSGVEFVESNLERNTVTNAVWKFSKFLKSNLSGMTFSGIIEDCHFEQCSFNGVKFEDATILNTFFKYNKRFKKIQFVNCKVDSITYAFLKSNQANLSGISVL